ncbi:MAG: NTP transferase domain-containing protein [Actinomycetia bacterium]|nr:NTP transferase domain-containing protein [Actinomycetes bacterium]
MKKLRALIQAGGNGARLTPSTTVLPQALMPIGDGTVISRQLTQLSAAGVDHVVVTLQHHGELISSYCGDGSRWNVTLEYLQEDVPLGTIGALDSLADRLDSSFLVLNSDVYTEIDLRSVVASHNASECALTIVTTSQEVYIAYGVLEHADGRLIDFIEKPREQLAVSAGIYCMSREVLGYIPTNQPFGFDELVTAMLDAGEPISTYHHDAAWIDIGRIEDLRSAEDTAVRSLGTTTI